MQRAMPNSIRCHPSNASTVGAVLSLRGILKRSMLGDVVGVQVQRIAKFVHALAKGINLGRRVHVNVDNPIKACNTAKCTSRYPSVQCFLLQWRTTPISRPLSSLLLFSPTHEICQYLPRRTGSIQNLQHFANSAVPRGCLRLHSRDGALGNPCALYARHRGDTDCGSISHAKDGYQRGMLILQYCGRKYRQPATGPQTVALRPSCTLLDKNDIGVQDGALTITGVEGSTESIRLRCAQR